MHQYTKPLFFACRSWSVRRIYIALPFLLLLVLSGLLINNTATAQEKGVHFEHGLSWAQVQAKAKAENKYIFVDCFTTWCGPCRYMRTEIFPQEEMGAYFNDKFVNIEVQLDTTAKDNDQVKSWYADAHAIMTQYSIRAFPTYLIFSPDGHALHRIVGAGSVQSFIGDVRESFDTTKQYYTKLKQFENGRRDSAFLRQFAMQVHDAYDIALGSKVVKAYLAGQPTLLTPAALDLIYLYTSRTTDEYFGFLTKHIAEINGVLGAGKAEDKIRNIFMVEGRILRYNEKRVSDWQNYPKKIAAVLPSHANEIMMRIDIDYYLAKKDWPNFEKTITAYMKQYSKQMNDNEMNSIAWSVFQNCSDASCVSQILDLSSQLKHTTVPAYLDTYANLLYKLGKKDEAIAMEQKAVDASSDDERAGNQSTLDKMKKGEKTWD
ncbi:MULTISPECIES: thioredoxin family protein [Niastella]|uniref:Thioredoxin fold domain-containing protein n=1 Tax=Niastella soli TaxID=2821487 RepID=A0ABS3YL80_9BACT|nr:thioredoxin family protein [Niastella soli]MBO9198649.1 thioredoxin fold domain-containing protein [Niastella soli]